MLEILGPGVWGPIHLYKVSIRYIPEEIKPLNVEHLSAVLWGPVYKAVYKLKLIMLSPVHSFL